MSTNRFSNSNPTPPNDSIANVQWPRVNDDQQYYEIGSVVRSSSHPHRDRMQFWNSMKDKLS